MDKKVCTRLRRGHPRNIPNLVTTKHISLPPDPKNYSMIEQLKTTLAKIILYDLISSFETYREILYTLFKKNSFHQYDSCYIFQKS